VRPALRGGRSSKTVIRVYADGAACILSIRTGRRKVRFARGRVCIAPAAMFRIRPLFNARDGVSRIMLLIPWESLCFDEK